MRSLLPAPCFGFPGAEYLEVMKDKDLVMRTDVFEVALAQLEGGAALNAH